MRRQGDFQSHAGQPNLQLNLLTTIMNRRISARSSSHPSHIFNMPPKKVVKASSDYNAQAVGELSFTKGEFFYVISESSSDYYEVINPVKKSRGIVPQRCFDNLDKVIQEAALRHSAPEGIPGGVNPSRKSSNSPQHASLMTLSEIDLKMREWKDTVESIIIQEVALKNSQWTFTIQIKFTNGSSHVLFRTWDDFYILHIGLLNHFPKESGRTGQGRVIPFLNKQIVKTQDEATKTRSILDTYMLEIIKLPSCVLASSQAKRFFMLKTGDLNTSIDIRFDSSDALMDLLMDYGTEPILNFSLVIGKERIKWSSEWVSMDDIWDRGLEEGNEGGLFYKDECGSMINLVGEEDLQLFVRTNPKGLEFHLN